MSNDREALLEAVKEAHREQGYHKPALFHEAIYDTVTTAVAEDLKSRPRVAILRPKLMSTVWPLVQAPDELEADDPDRILKIMLYKELNKRTWETTAPLSGRIQTLCESRNGYVVCRLGGLLGDAVYVTSDPDCFRVDVIESRSNKDITAVTKLAMFYGRVSKRIPAMAPMIAESFEASLLGVLAAGRAHIPALAQGSEEE